MASAPLAIVTGASRGMGLALARLLLDAGYDLLCISRKTNDELAALAQARDRAIEQWPQDLARAETAAAKLETWLAQKAGDPPAAVTLVNNAGVLPRIGPIGDVPAADLAQALRVDLEAPMLLTGAFLRATAQWTCPRKVLNISSGLGRKAMAAQAGYCAAKAGMDHFTRCVALEEAGKPNGARVCSIAPGVIDTDMQHDLRSADGSLFPDRGMFEGLKAKGQLATPEEAAQRLLAYLQRPDFGSNPVADVRD
jgi:NAD(P)-dependent dehydrogenase (short-subunit alcohol dehydrogenase family)